MTAGPTTMASAMALSRRLRVKRNDRPREVTGVVRDVLGPVEISDAQTATLLVREREDVGELVVSQALEILDDGTDALRGRWRFVPAEDTFAVGGTFKAEVEVVWPDGTRLTFPDEGYAEVVVEADLGP